MGKSRELEKWEEVKKRVEHIDRVTLGPYYSEIKLAPRRVLFALSHYKFAAKMLGAGKYVLEVGCSEGLGTLFLAELARKVVAVDLDSEAIKEANMTFRSEKIEFINLDFLESQLGEFDGIVALDVIEHIYPEHERLFMETICNNLKDYGVCIIGTPNKNAEVYASPGSIMGHVNLYSWERLKNMVEAYFHQVFLFSANDEVIHTGFYPMAHYLMVVAVSPIRVGNDNKGG
jgi:2-polyprenyl-3-methyl-5-hydroxy-6-metoxy-1,4-benzoquinol methylase